MNKKTPYKYRLILVKNKIYQETINKYVHYERALNKYDEIIHNNKKNIIFPKEYINMGGNFGGIQELTYEILLVKTNDELVDYSLVENEYKVKEKITTEMNRFIILKKNKIFIEEDFYVFGYNPHNDRKDIKFILKEYVFSDLKNIIDIYRLGNKIIFIKTVNNEDFFNMIITKNKSDGERLFNFLKLNLGKNNKNLIFNEINNRKILNFLYEKAIEHTGWDKQKLKRHNTRP